MFKKMTFKKKMDPGLDSFNQLSFSIMGFDQNNKLIFLNRHLKNQIGQDTLKTETDFTEVVEALQRHCQLENAEEIISLNSKNSGREPQNTTIHYYLKGKHYRGLLASDTILSNRGSSITLYYVKERSEVRGGPHDEPPRLTDQTWFRERLTSALSSGINQTALIRLSLDRYSRLISSLTPIETTRLDAHIMEKLGKAFHSSELTSHRWEEGLYTLIYPALNSITELVNRLEQVLAVFKQPFIINGKAILIQASLGISLYPSRCDTANALIHQADMALDIARKRGGNQYVIYSPELKEGQYRQYLINQNLSQALYRNELSLRYQPRIDSRGRIVSVESLLRWNHPEMGEISPGEFIPSAEDSGEIIQIGEWALRKACLQARRWMIHGLDLIISVNISPVQIHQDNACRIISDVLNESGLSPDRLELEVTETTLLNQLDKTIHSLRELHKLGIRISLDDFGTGFSSLSYLGTFPVDILKIDQSFIRDIHRNDNHMSVVQAIASLAKSFRCKVIAEGVETEEQLNILKKIGCDEYQGYYYHKPLTPDELEELCLEKVAT